MLKQCSKCKVSKSITSFPKNRAREDGFHPYCKQCKQQSNRVSYARHAEEVKERARIYRRLNADEVRETNRKYRHRNKEKVRQYHHRQRNDNLERYRGYERKYHKAHREEIRERHKTRAIIKHDEVLTRYREWRRKNADYLREYERQWRKNNKDKVKAKCQNRRARKRNNGGSFTSHEWKELCARYDNRCLCCGEVKPLTADHVVPLSQGGLNSIDNIQPLCKSCNSRKRTKTTDYRPDQ